MMRWIVALTLALASVAPTLGCGSREADASGVTVSEASARITDDVGAVYFRVENAADTDDRLVRVEPRGGAVAELHELVEEGDVVRMVAQERGFPVPARGVLELRPGGKHVMLFGSSAGAFVELDLVFERTAPINVLVPARGVGE